MFDFKKENEKFLQKNKELFEPYTDCLISKEKVLLMLSELLEVANKEGFSVEDTIDHAYEWVKNMSKAYDVDKVVDELEKLKAEKDIGTCKVVVKECIEIVKTGGKNG